MKNLFVKFVTEHGGQPPVLYWSINQTKLLVNIVQYCKRKPIYIEERNKHAVFANYSCIYFCLLGKISSSVNINLKLIQTKKNLSYSTHHPFFHPSHRISNNRLEGTYCSLGKSNKSCNQYTLINLFLKLTKGKKFPLTTLINTTCFDH